MRHRSPDFVATVGRFNRTGVPLGLALRGIIGDKNFEWPVRGQAADLLATIHDREAPLILLRLFFTEEDSTELWNIALVIEALDDVRAVGPLIQALEDGNPHRRGATARSLGLINDPHARAVPGLMRVLTDSSQPVNVRTEAAESRAYLSSFKAIPALIAMLSDSNAEVRFWCVFAIGKIKDRRTCHNTNRTVIPALEAMLTDDAVPPGNWWSVGREALAMLGSLNPPAGDYTHQLATEIQLIRDNPNASAEDRGWADCYDRLLRNNSDQCASSGISK